MQSRKVFFRILMFVLRIAMAAVISIAIYMLGEMAYEFGHSIYDGQAMSMPPGQDIVIVVPEGSSAADVAEILEEKGLIKDRRVFRVQERLSKYHGQIQAGDYVLNTSWNAEALLAVLTGHPDDLEKETGDE